MEQIAVRHKCLLIILAGKSPPLSGVGTQSFALSRGMSRHCAHIRVESPGPAAACPTPSKAFPLTRVSVPVPFILCVFQFFFCFLQLIWWGVTVRGRARDAEGAGGAKEKIDFHHEEQALEDGEEALSAQVPIKMGTPNSWVLCWLLSEVFPWNFVFAAAVIPQYQKKWPAEHGQPVCTQMIRVKMCNLIFSLCNQRTDKVQICSTDTHGQVILPSYIKPNDSLQSGYLLNKLCTLACLFMSFVRQKSEQHSAMLVHSPEMGLLGKNAVLFSEVYGAKINLPHSPWWRWEQLRQQQRPLSAGQWGTMGQSRPGNSKPMGW